MQQEKPKVETQREKRKRQWLTIKRNFPAAMELARPYLPLWLLGLGLLLIGRLAGLALPAAPKILIDDVLPNGNMAVFNWLLGGVLVATLIQGLASFALTQTISKAGQRLIADLRLKVHDHVISLPIRYFDDHKAGEVVSRVMDDVEGVRNLIGTGMIEFLGGLLSSSLILVILFYLNWTLTLAIFICIVVFLVILIKSFMILGPVFRERQELKAELSARLTEGIGGIRVVKAYNSEQIERKEIAGGVGRLLGNVLKTINTISVLSLMTAILTGVLGTVILYFGGNQMIAGQFSTGEFISYIAFLALMIAPLSSILMVGTQLSEAFAGIERMNEVLSQYREDSDEADRQPFTHIDGHIEFRDVSFEYVEGKPVLTSIQLDAKPDTVTAIVGPSGSGKSTLIGLIASFYHPTKGEVFVDGQDITTLRLSDFRKQLGVVLQENFLFAGTIRQNIVYTRPEATDEQVHEAASRAHCLEFIDKFPDGMETIVGERGVKLSGGQRQRLAIARALLADPKVLILDEATSSLDSESEAAIQEALSLLMRGRTTFVIAHRLSTVRHADQILVLEDGQIVERGTHTELITAQGRYFEMVQRQYGIESNLLLCPGEGAKEEEGEDDEKTSTDKKARGDRLTRLLSGE